MTYTTFILDLDGTLLDTLTDLTEAVNHAFRIHNLPAANSTSVRRCLGNGYARLIGDLLGDAVNEEKQIAILEEFNTYYGDHCMDKTAPYDGIIETLHTMKERGARLAIVSNKGNEAVQQLRARFFQELIEIAVGESPTVRRKPNPDAVIEAMRALEATPGTSVYVGDSEVDIETARRATLPCISCTWGFRTEEHLRQHGGTCFIHRPEELLQYL